MPWCVPGVTGVGYLPATSAPPAYGNLTCVLLTGMHCAHARTAGYSPQFCTAMSGDGGCPQLACHRYERQTDCQGAPEQGFTTGHVCMRAERVAGCTHASAQNSLAAADTNMAAVRPCLGEQRKGQSEIHLPS